MAKKEKQNEPTLVLDDKEYNINDLQDDQKLLVAHINDLNRKVDSARFNLQQMEMGRQSFVQSLKNSLEAPEASEEKVEA
jgi:hypothetical protein|tara:strand:+ start:35 stop:274 length:240 start_codon:yes stop_codon:yes gene_type:complete